MKVLPVRSYKLTHDAGFAPNPFFGYLTLATCKPGIRRAAKVGEWIAGFTSGGLCGDPVGGERLIYLMRVSEILSFEDYFNDSRFMAKKPKLDGHSEVARHGDNIYQPLRHKATEASDFKQLRNPHHWDRGCSDTRTTSKAHDLAGRNVLIGTEFAYFGRNPLEIPETIRPNVPIGQSASGSLTHEPERIRALVDFVFANAKRRLIAPPHAWLAGDVSWRQ
jgi:hypothetical protein